MRYRTMFKRTIQQHGIRSTLHHRNLWDGDLTATAAGSGGSIPAGTQYYTVSVTVSGTEYWCRNYVTVTTVASDKVTLTWGGVAGMTNYKVYRNTDNGFPTPSLIATVTSGETYTDTAATPSAGSPTTTVTQDVYTYFTDEPIKALEAGQVREGYRFISGGKAIAADIQISIPYDVDVDDLDEITYNGRRYEVCYVRSPVLQGETQLHTLICRLRT